MTCVCCDNYCSHAYVTIWDAFYLEEKCKQNGKAKRENKLEYLHTLTNIYGMEISKNLEITKYLRLLSNIYGMEVSKNLEITKYLRKLSNIYGMEIFKNL